MKNQKVMFTSVLFALACFAVSPAALAIRPPSGEDRGNGNSAAQNVQALNFGTTGTENTAQGWFSLFSNTSGSSNTATGFKSLYSNTYGSFNTANGSNALFSNTTASSNTATGYDALFSNTTGAWNTANGYIALLWNTTGSRNVACGFSALRENRTGDDNTAIGVDALAQSTTGYENTALGDFTLFWNITGNLNTALGSNAGFSQTTGSRNVYIGYGTTGVAGENDSCYIASIFGQTSAEGTAVYINSAGKLGTATSSRRFKEDIKPMDDASETLFALKPVIFRYKKEIDPKGISQFGLVAEDVEKVNPELVVRDKDGKVNTVRYEAVNAMLLNEFLKERKKVEAQETTIRKLKSNAASQEATISELRKGMGTLTAQVKEQAAQIQKVSTQLEMSKPSTRLALSNP